MNDLIWRKDLENVITGLIEDEADTSALLSLQDVLAAVREAPSFVPLDRDGLRRAVKELTPPDDWMGVPSMVSAWNEAIQAVLATLDHRATLPREPEHD